MDQMDGGNVKILFFFQHFLQEEKEEREKKTHSCNIQQQQEKCLYVVFVNGEKKYIQLQNST